MNDRSLEELDEIDRQILRILGQDPRLPYSDIAEKLEEEGHQMSSEGIRYRVSNLFETTSILLLTAPKQHGWEVVRLFITVANEPDAKDITFDQLVEMDFWMTCRLIGDFDFYAIATIKSNSAADELIDDVQGLDHVTEVEYSFETDRVTDVDKYLSF